ncbi:MAG: hypothetical protein AAB589_00945 [Patescibacteria group bacterium]
MSQIVFNPDDREYRRAGRGVGRGGLVGLVMRLGARSEASANFILLVSALAIFVLAGIIFFFNS